MHLIHSLWGIYLVSENLTALDDLIHFTLREWSRLCRNVSSAEVERAKAQLKASILLSLDGTTAVAEDIGRQKTVAIAGGRSKIEPIRGVLASGLIHGLITDERTAKALLA